MVEMDELTNEATEQPQEPVVEATPAPPPVPAPPITSRFLFVDVAALRAKQLRRGARPRIDLTEVNAPKKAERMAMEEVRHGLVYYEVPEKKHDTGEAQE